MSFENPAREKKFYKVKIRGEELDNVKIQGRVTEGASWTDIGTCSGTTGATTGEDIFDMPVALKKGYYLQLYITTASSTNRSDGIIQDITIVFRNRRIK